ncbi:MAG: DUF1992 domain-containing protein [Burkholderiales bacterium]|nr:DUF1992 domain-containing protein [Burkholderiales bacterium]
MSTRPDIGAVAAMSGWDALVEAKIAEAQRAGAFDDLPGAGRPLELDDDRLVPEDVRMAHRILRNAGFVPPEIEARREAADLRQLIAATTEDPEKRRALARLALLEARLDARGAAAPRTSGYYAALLARFDRAG